MALLNRLIGQNMTPAEEALGSLPIHQAIAAWGEHINGQAPYDDWNVLISRFGLTPTEDVELQGWTIAVGQGAFTLEELEYVLLLGEAGGPTGPYLTEAEIRVRLGIP